MSSKITIVLAEDHVLMRKALVDLINNLGHFQVIGEVNNGKELLRLLRTHKPDIILLDLEMPIMNGWEVMERLASRPVRSAVVILSQHFSKEMQLHFISKGAKAYLPKNCGAEQFLKTLLEVHHKGFCFEEEVMAGLIGYNSPEELPNRGQISAREREVLVEIGNGLTDIQIADKLHITKHTVHSHRMNLLNKTRTSNSAELVKFAVRRELI